jgi:hypothetical protein
LALLRGQGAEVSHLFQCPGLKVDHVLVDWLHTVDLGVGQDALGNLFYEVAELLPGATHTQRVEALWAKIRQYYKEKKPTSQLQKLTATMICTSGKKKLRAKAAETRHLLPFGYLLACEYADGNEHMAAVSVLFENLLDCLQCLGQQPFPHEKASSASRKFLAMCAALETEARAKGDFLSWRMKPKHHLFQELMEYQAVSLQASPDLWWTYYDESWGGVLANAAARRGGCKTVQNIAENVVNRFRAFCDLSANE